VIAVPFGDWFGAQCNMDQAFTLTTFFERGAKRRIGRYQWTNSVDEMTTNRSM
jgi:hypothetical protein